MAPLIIPIPRAIEPVMSKNFAQWSKSVRNGDHEAVAQLYAEEATFHPTLSDQFVRGRKDIAEYFEYFLKFQPVPSIVEEAVQSIGEAKLYLHTGIYRFDFREASHHLIARFSFLHEWDGRSWTITHHHSSSTPPLAKS